MFLVSTHTKRTTPSIVTVLTAAATSLFWVIAANQASAQPPSIMAPGDAIVTGFSGVLPPSPPPPAMDPLDETLINLDGASMQIQHLQPNGPPTGQLIPSPTVFTATARDVGQVFAITLDDAPAPNIFLGATSAFGLQIVKPDSNGDGIPERLKTGQPGATFMPGQWGAGGAPGSIYRVDGTTGAISLFTTIGANAGPGLGDVVFDKASHQFFVSDLDTGLIHRLDSTGLLKDTFDHGLNGRPAHGLAPVADDGSSMNIADPGFKSEDPATWGYTQKERMVWGMAMHGGRLYYAVADGPQIWSIGIRLDGTFANDPRWELDVAGLASANPVSDIVFDGQGRMILAQRGPQRGSYDYSIFAEPAQSSVVRYGREIPDDPTTPGTWVPVPEEYAIGFRPESRNTTGGIALGYGYDSTGAIRSGSCGEFLWTTGDSLRDNPALAAQLAAGGPAIVHGLQGNDHDLVRPANDPPFSSYFADYDGKFDDPANQGHLGDVEIWQPCEGGQSIGTYIPPYAPPPGYTPPPPTTFNLTIDKEAEPYTCVPGGLGWLCFYTVRVANTGSTIYWGPIAVDDWLPGNPPGAVMHFGPQPPWLCGALGPTEYQCSYPPVFLFPGESVDLYVMVELPAADEVCYLDNAAHLTWPPGYGDANPADDFAFASAQVPSEACPPPHGDTTNLKIEKYAQPDMCVKSPAGWDCEYMAVVTNTGPAVYHGGIQVTDTLPFPGPLAYAPAPLWTCLPAGGLNYVCTHPPVTLNPGEGVDLWVGFTVPDSFANPGQCHVPNVATITAPVGGAQNTSAADDAAMAAAKIDMVPIPVPGGAVIIPCDPPSLRLEKIADPPLCVKAAVGWECSFTVKVTSLGPDPYHGTIEIDETLPAGTTLKSFSPPWSCSGASPAMHCSYPSVDLAVGDSRELKVTIAVPDSFAKSGQCAITNHVQTSVAAAVLHSDKAAQYMASATAQIPADQCGPPKVLCPIDQRTPTGECCPDGQKWNGRSCGAAPPQQCPAGTTGVYPNCKAPTCPRGFTGVYPDCKPPACPPRYTGVYPDCKPPACPRGYTGVYPNCKPPACPQGYTGVYPDCKPPACPRGYTGVYPDCRPPACPKGYSGVYPDCRPPACPRGSVGTPPNCRCPPNTHGTPPRCVADRCPTGFVGTPPNCTRLGILKVVPQLAPTACPAGTAGKFPDCKQIIR